MKQEGFDKLFLARIEELGEAFYDMLTPEFLQVDSLTTLRLHFQFGVSIALLICLVCAVVFLVDRMLEKQEAYALKKVPIRIKLPRFQSAQQQHADESAYETMQNRRKAQQQDRRQHSLMSQYAVDRRELAPGLANIDEKHIPTFYKYK